MEGSDEKELVEQAQRDPRAFGPIYDRYVERIYGFVLRRTGNRHIAEDITASTFESALRSIRKFRWQGTGIAAWLYQIGRNKLIAHYRRQRLRSSLTILLARGFHPSTHADFTAELETNDRLLAAYSQLDNRDQEVIGLRFFEELSSDEVAQILICSKNTLYVRLHRALGRMRTLLERMDEMHAVGDEEE